MIYFDGEQNGEKLQEALCSYTTETLDCIHTVRGLPGWIHERKGELNKIKAIKNRADKLQENLNPFELMDRTRRQAVLREELALVLEDTLKGLEKLSCFVDAVKKLAVTSPRVFMQEKHVVIHLPAGVSLELVQEVIQAARLICPILFTYEQEADDSFLPELQNLEVISQQLDENIQTVQRIYDILEIRHLSQRMSTETAVALAEDLSEDDIRRMLSDIKQLDEIRKDQHFWTVFLFQEGTESEFIREFEERQPKMLQSLRELKQVAVLLDSMNLWARISDVVGSSVVTVGVLLIIAGLGLIPFTDGGSLALTVMGLVIIGTNRVNAAFTRATEIGVNTTQQQKAKESLENFKEDLQSIQACLDEVLCSYTTETLDCIHTVRGLPGWIHERKGELNKIKDIKNRADKLQENLNPFELMDRTRRQAVLREEQELALVLEDTLKGLEKLGCFLDAVKKLAVTSPRVFMQEKHVVIHLPAGVSLELVQEVIQAARLICPILFTYEQEADDSFLPKLQNLEVISQQLDEYIQTVQRIYDILEIRHLSQRMSTETAVALAEDLSEDDIRRMLSSALYDNINTTTVARDPYHSSAMMLLFSLQSVREGVTQG
uniref:uncharacterized protein n=1 Tax=Semicossyphus pulcher TaxID=241346 RepID=UPI0037E9B214